MLTIVLVSIGGIYVGVFTPSEAAAIGARTGIRLRALAPLARRRQPVELLVETVSTTALVFLILIGALVFGPFLALSGLPEHIAQHSPACRYRAWSS